MDSVDAAPKELPISTAEVRKLRAAFESSQVKIEELASYTRRRELKHLEEQNIAMQNIKALDAHTKTQARTIKEQGQQISALQEEITKIKTEMTAHTDQLGRRKVAIEREAAHINHIWGDLITMEDELSRIDKNMCSVAKMHNFERRLWNRMTKTEQKIRRLGLQIDSRSVPWVLMDLHAEGGSDDDYHQSDDNSEDDSSEPLEFHSSNTEESEAEFTDYGEEDDDASLPDESIKASSETGDMQDGDTSAVEGQGTSPATNSDPGDTERLNREGATLPSAEKVETGVLDIGNPNEVEGQTSTSEKGESGDVEEEEAPVEEAPPVINQNAETTPLPMAQNEPHGTPTSDPARESNVKSTHVSPAVATPAVASAEMDTEVTSVTAGWTTLVTVKGSPETDAGQANTTATGNKPKSPAKGTSKGRRGKQELDQSEEVQQRLGKTRSETRSKAAAATVHPSSPLTEDSE